MENNPHPQQPELEEPKNKDVGSKVLVHHGKSNFKAVVVKEQVFDHILIYNPASYTEYWIKADRIIK